MPVDFLVCILPLLILSAAVMAMVVPGTSRSRWRWIARALLGVFLLVYFVPGWVLWVFAQAGDREAQYNLGNYYTTRLGSLWSDIDARDKWWVEAARQGHPQAMHNVGYFSMFGTSRHIPKDLVAARKWLEGAQAAGDLDAPDTLKALAEEEAIPAAK